MPSSTPKSRRVREELVHTLEQATVANGHRTDLGLHVLTYDDLGLPSFGGVLSLANQLYRELQASINGAGNVGSFVSAITQPKGG